MEKIINVLKCNFEKCFFCEGNICKHPDPQIGVTKVYMAIAGPLQTPDYFPGCQSHFPASAVREIEKKYQYIQEVVRMGKHVAGGQNGAG